MTSRKVICKITGKFYTFNADYYLTKVEEYSDEESLKNFFITKKAKSLLVRGYSVQEIRNILEVEESDELLQPNSTEMQNIVNFHKLKSNIKTKKASNANFATHKSDPEVIKLINNIKSNE